MPQVRAVIANVPGLPSVVEAEEKGQSCEADEEHHGHPRPRHGVGEYVGHQLQARERQLGIERPDSVAHRWHNLHRLDTRSYREGHPSREPLVAEVQRDVWEVEPLPSRRRQAAVLVVADHSHDVRQVSWSSRRNRRPSGSAPGQ